MRFVLKAEAPYMRNVAALWAVDPLLAREIEALPALGSSTGGETVGDGDGYLVEASKSGEPTLRVRTGDGREVYLHSRYRPAEEGRRLVEKVPFDRRVAFYVHGFGLGYHVETLFERASKEAIFCVFEPDLELLRAAMGNRDLSRLIESRRVLFFWREEKSALFVRLTPHSAQLSMGVEYVHHAASVQLRPEYHRQMQVWLGEFASYCRTSMQTLVLNGRRTAENIARNIGYYVAAPGVERVKGRYAGCPAIVVSAGPSLRKNKHLLKEAAGRAVIIAVQTTLQPLLEMGVEPDFVTSLDYHDICARFFEKLGSVGAERRLHGLKARGTGEVSHVLRTELVAEVKASSRIFSMFPGPVSLLGNDFAEGLLREMGLNRMRLPAGATVAHLAYYLAEHLGCDPIIFVGQDLGFSDGLCYTPGTAYEDVWRPELGRFCTLEMKQWEQIVRDRPILRRVPDQEGRPMYTEERLFTYLQQFERDFARSDRRIIDATEGGARKRGAEVMRLAEALELFCTKPLPEVVADHPGLRWDVLSGCIECLGNRQEEAKEIESVAEQTVPLLEEIREHIDDQGRVNRAIARVDELRRRMDGLGPCYELVMQMSQQTELERFRQDREIALAKVDGVERQRRQVMRDIGNVVAVREAGREFVELMGVVIARLQDQKRE
jgi:hypothetical protein